MFQTAQMDEKLSLSSSSSCYAHVAPMTAKQLGNLLANFCNVKSLKSSAEDAVSCLGSPPNVSALGDFMMTCPSLLAVYSTFVKSMTPLLSPPEKSISGLTLCAQSPEEAADDSTNNRIRFESCDGGAKLEMVAGELLRRCNGHDDRHHDDDDDDTAHLKALVHVLLDKSMMHRLFDTVVMQQQDGDDGAAASAVQRAEALLSSAAYHVCDLYTAVLSQLTIDVDPVHSATASACSDGGGGSLSSMHLYNRLVNSMAFGRPHSPL